MNKLTFSILIITFVYKIGFKCLKIPINKPKVLLNCLFSLFINKEFDVVLFFFKKKRVSVRIKLKKIKICEFLFCKIKNNQNTFKAFNYAIILN